MVFGVVVALIGIIQKAVLGDQAWDGMKIYGFWEPRYKLTTPFGPFVNKNHFAGWMLMALPTALGYLLAQAEIGMRNVAARLAPSLPLAVVARGRTPPDCGVRRRGHGRLADDDAARGRASPASAWPWPSRRWPWSDGSARPGRGLPSSWRSACSWLRRCCGPTPTSASVSRPRNTSFELRKAIWSDAVRVMEDFPVVGTGFNTFAAAMRVYQTASDELMVSGSPQRLPAARCRGRAARGRADRLDAGSVRGWHPAAFLVG